MLLKKIKNQQAYTLIEMIVAISIFTLTLLIVVNIYLIVNNSQRKVVTMQKIQDDVRYMFEAIAQEIRLGKINYDFYNNNDDTPINLHPEFGGDQNHVLAITNQLQEQIFFRRSSNTPDANDGTGVFVQYCKIDINNSSCDLLDDSNWQNITPEGVRVLDLSFLITPSADPFIDSSSLTCLTSNPCTGSCLSYKWNSGQGICEYYSDGSNFQPKVKIILKTRGEASSIAEESEIIMQTTVSSRLISNVVQNTYYD